MSEQRTASVLVVSTSAAAGTAEDTTGAVIAGWLRERGFGVSGPTIVADGPAVGVALRAALIPVPAAIITTGGTGVSPTDRTPEETDPLLEVRLPGFGEELRRRGMLASPSALMTRACAGFAGATLIVNLPGSPAGVRDGLDVLAPILDHLLNQREGERRHSSRDRVAHHSEIA